MGGAELGDPEILVRPVTAAPGRSRLIGAPSSGAAAAAGGPPRPGRASGRESKIDMRTVRALVARDLAADIAELLASGADLRRPGPGAPATSPSSSAPTSRRTWSGTPWPTPGFPAVVAGAGSVFHPGRRRLAGPAGGAGTAAPLGPGAGRGADPVPRADRGRARRRRRGSLTDELGATAAAWAGVLAARGVAALLEVAVIEQDLPARLLARQDGERQLTDLRHVGQGLHAAALEEGLGLPALAEWLRRRRDEAAADIATDRIRRLDTDAAAVQVVTLHASKGLQYPVVYLPFAFDRWVPKPDVLLLHDDTASACWTSAGRHAGRVDRQRRAATEQAGEALRLLYVGLTRAQSQVVTWWAPTSNTHDSGLHRVLFGANRDSAGGARSEARIPSDDQAAATAGSAGRPRRSARSRPPIVAAASRRSGRR